ncbi:MAG TPA: aspartate aminotransferase family protein [Bacteroidales bacterium]|nr:aspartate aminotransferase family protein [Bacteroidales bacterium]
MLSEKSLFLRHLAQTSANPMMIEVKEARGVWLYGPEGEKYIDLISGVSVCNVGHRHPDVVKAAKEQLDKYMHLMVYGEMVQTPQVEYARMITELLPSNLQSVYFVNSGSEAVEGALKLAKRYTGRSKIVSFRNAYHGSTHGALSVQGDEYYKSRFRPLLPDIHILEFNRPELLVEIDERTAAVIIEPVQGEAGIITAEKDFLESLRQRCTDNSAILIFDEIQTGFGRTGFLFALRKYNVVPDILLLGKALGGGLPLGAFISSKEIMHSLSENPALGHITTFGGNPVSCATGIAALKVIIENELEKKAEEKAQLFRKRLVHRSITGIRGTGLFLAVELGSSLLVSKLISEGTKNGLILDYFLFCDNAFRIAPPLTIKNEEIEYACNKILETLDVIS